ncbi:MAG: hypothetical protein MI861_19075, partial [Pirellulales bacterium]|nr:hypothetical protein [Pirellulales bacterium]
TTFEAAAERLEKLDSLYFEPDGSFVWVAEGGDQQIDGMLYDAAGRLQYVEIRGICQIAVWRQLLAAIGGDFTVAMEVMKLPDRQLQDLQTFERNHWGENTEER